MIFTAHPCLSTAPGKETSRNISWTRSADPRVIARTTSDFRGAEPLFASTRPVSGIDANHGEAEGLAFV